ncbi:hypothetical protein [Streptomyces sp. WM4235]|uniref:hypothetical protein n=1 Tax=Streptomyces sp. WM4235 TaxID=1415551 RepID=UPI0018FE400E|nr:hypothetical protein [Streptomyces sp. WM4235]
MNPKMLNGGMVRRKKEKKKRPPFGMPKEISLSATPEGWRTSIRERPESWTLRRVLATAGSADILNA